MCGLVIYNRWKCLVIWFMLKVINHFLCCNRHHKRVDNAKAINLCQISYIKSVGQKWFSRLGGNNRTSFRFSVSSSCISFVFSSIHVFIPHLYSMTVLSWKIMRFLCFYCKSRNGNLGFHQSPAPRFCLSFLWPFLSQWVLICFNFSSTG